MIGCDLCQADNGLYDFDQDCCLVRFALHVPTKAMRAGYLAWWVQRYGHQRTDRLKLLIEQAWKERIEENKKAVLGFGKTHGESKA